MKHVTLEDFRPATPPGYGGSMLWMYTTTDRIQTVINDDYFAPAVSELHLRPGDWIAVNSVTTHAEGYASALFVVQSVDPTVIVARLGT